MFLYYFTILFLPSSPPFPNGHSSIFSISTGHFSIYMYLFCLFISSTFSFFYSSSSSSFFLTSYSSFLLLSSQSLPPPPPPPPSLLPPLLLPPPPPPLSSPSPRFPHSLRCISSINNGVDDAMDVTWMDIRIH